MKKRNRERSLAVEGDFRGVVRGGLAEEVHVPCALTEISWPCGVEGRASQAGSSVSLSQQGC